MSLQVEKLEKNMAKLTIEVPSEEFDKALKSAYNRTRADLTFPASEKAKRPRP